MRLAHADCLCSLLLMAGGVILYQEISVVPFEGRIFPQVLIMLLMACGLLLGIRGLLALRRKTGKPFLFFGDMSAGRWAMVVCLFIGYVAFSMNLSFLCGTFLIAFILPLMLEQVLSPRKLIISGVYAAGLTLFFYAFFIRIMNFQFESFF